MNEKRYKVVQDARGYWGIWDRENEDFASWGDPLWTGAECIDDMVHWAAKLNSWDASHDEFGWTGEYLPRENA